MKEAPRATIPTPEPRPDRPAVDPSSLARQGAECSCARKGVESLGPRLSWA